MLHILVTSALVVLLAALPSGGQAAPKDGTLVIAYKAETPTMDPHTESSAVSNMRNRWVMQGLMHKTPEGKLITLVAKSYKWVDPKTLEFEIKPGIKFSNGEELDAHAVKYSLDRVHDPKVKSRQIDRLRIIAHKDAVQAVDKYRVRFNLAFPDAGFVNRMGNIGLIVPPKAYAAKEPIFWSSNQIGSGPYMMKKWERDTITEFEANPLFWDSQYPKVKRVVVKIIPEEGARVAALVKGEVDVVFDVPPVMFDRINQSGKARVVSKPGIRIFRVGFFNKHGGLFNDKRVRMAVAHAIDREALFKSILKDTAVDASTLLHPFNEGWGPFAKYEYPYKYDLARAKKLLAEAGHPSGIEVDFVVELGQYMKTKEAAEVLNGMLNKAGIRTKFVGLNLRGYRNYFRKHRDAPQKDFKPYLFMHSFGGGSGDSDLQLGAMASCKGAWSGWCDKEFDKALTATSSVLGEEEREKAFAGLARKITEDAVVVPIYRLNATFGLSNRVDWDPRVDERVMAWEIGLK